MKTDKKECPYCRADGGYLILLIIKNRQKIFIKCVSWK